MLVYFYTKFKQQLIYSLPRNVVATRLEETAHILVCIFFYKRAAIVDAKRRVNDETRDAALEADGTLTAAGDEDFGEAAGTEAATGEAE
jgi:hypothetical protein